MPSHPPLRLRLPARRIAGLLAPLAFAVGCSHGIDGPSPTLTPPVAPQAVCNEQTSSTLVLMGTGLSPLTDHTLLDKTRLELPQPTLLRVKDIDGNATDSTQPANVVNVPNDPDNAAKSDVAWTSMQQMSVGFCPPGTCSQAAMPTPPQLVDYDVAAFADMKLPTGLYSINVKNRNGHDTTLANALLVVPLPRLDKVTDDLLCFDKDNVVQLDGDFFYKITDGAGSRQTDVFIGDKKMDTSTVVFGGCRPLPSPDGIKVEACKGARVSIAKGTFALKNAGDTFITLPIKLQGPDPLACHSDNTKNPVDITFVPMPTLATVVPDILCIAEGDRTFTATGTGFLVVDGKLPTVNGVGMALPTAAPAQCTAVGVTGHPREVVQSCKQLTVVVPKASVMPGNYNVTITNPKPADCTTNPIDLTITPQPSLMTIVPDFICNAQGDSTFTLTGAAFVTIDAAVPSVTINDMTGKQVWKGPAAPSAMSCTAQPGPTEKLQLCTTLGITVPKGTLSPGVYTVIVTNPDTAGCSSPQNVTFLVVPPPSLTRVAPTPICTAQNAQPFTLTGLHFYTVQGVVPTVTFTDPMGVAFTVTDGVPSMCTPVTGVMEVITECTTLTLTLGGMGGQMLQPGVTYTVTVGNPKPADCSSVEVVKVVGAAPPMIASVTPQMLCSGGGQITLAGTGFEPGALATVGGLSMLPTAVSMGGTRATVNVGNGLGVGGPYDVSIANPSGCSGTLAAQVTVQQGLSVFFVDPPVVYNGIQTVATVYASKLNGTFATIAIAPTGTSNFKTLMITGVVRNHATVAVPAGTPAGIYDVQVTDTGSACQAILVAGLKVVSTTTVTVTRITPAQGYFAVGTPVTILSNNDPRNPFKATPRAYLSSPMGGSAVALASVSFVDANTLTAVVPPLPRAGLVLDLTIVNPDGTVGVLAKAFTTVANPTPVIAGLQPGAIAAGAPPPVTVQGQNFQADAAITLTCRDQAGVPVAAPALMGGAPVVCGSQQCITLTLTGGTPGYCVVTVTNKADGTSFDFSSLVITNSGQKLGAFTAASSMNTSRRALGLVSGQATTSAQFVYAIGGDSGLESGALQSVESATVDVFGKFGKWTPLRQLPAARQLQTRAVLNHKRTFVGATTIGRWIYAVGGSDGTGALTSAERAFILDPTDVNYQLVISDLDIAPADPLKNEKGLAAGYYSYRVAPVMKNGDPFNPNGEGLPSDTFSVQAPALATGAKLTIYWNAITTAAYYRVYRSATPNMSSGAEVLIQDQVNPAVLPGNLVSFTDTGLTPFVNPDTPLPVGSLGSWNDVGQVMATARAGAGVTAVPDPARSNISYLFALGGNSGTEAAAMTVGTVEYLKITVNPDNSQLVNGGWTAGPSLATPRWGLVGYPQVIAGKSYVWAGGGFTGGGATSGGFEGTTVAAGGVPAAWTATSSVSPSRAGYAGVAINQFVYAFGGGGGVADISSKQSQVSAPPALGNFSNSTFLSTPRIWSAGTVESGFIFICGGSTGAAMPTASCEYAVW